MSKKFVAILIFFISNTLVSEAAQIIDTFHDFSTNQFNWSLSQSESRDNSVYEFHIPESHELSRNFTLGYPDIQFDTTDENLKKQNLFLYNFQDTEAYRFLPKDLIPYLGVRMNYSVSESFGFFNDITTKNIFYGFHYRY